MQQIRDAVAFASSDTQNAPAQDGPVGLDTSTAEATVGDIISKAAEELDKHIPETSPFKPFVTSALQMAAMFAIKAIFRHR
jgi:hypothetical protein